MLEYLSKLYESGALPVVLPGVTQKITVGSQSGQSAAFASTVVRVVASVDCHVEFGSNPTASTSSMLLPANTPEYFACRPTDKLAVAGDGTDGALYLTPAVAV
jgi:hypothetical protein